jgi:FKBP-type peptidyl-prolyl cis-trans isomerase
MTSRSILAAAILSSAIASHSVAQSVAPAPGTASDSGAMPAPAPQPPAVSGEQVFEVFGWAIGDQKNLQDLGLTEVEIEALIRGFSTAAKGQPPPDFFQQVAPMAQRFLNDRARSVQETAATANRAEEAEFFAAADKNPAIKKTESGLRYEIIEPGTDPKPTPADTVVAHYTLSFANGTVLETTRDSGEPAEFPLGGVIPAWTEGLQLIGVGGKIKLYVPSSLGYGEQGSPGGIPPAKLLVFEVELVEVKPPAPQLPGLDSMPGSTPNPTTPTPAPAP